jgi:hypothetical protein
MVLFTATALVAWTSANKKVPDILGFISVSPTLRIRIIKQTLIKQTLFFLQWSINRLSNAFFIGKIRKILGMFICD